MRVLGIDPGLTRCGLAVVDGDSSRRVSLVDVGVAKTPSDWEISRRLMVLSEHVAEWIRTHRPDAVAIEQVFAQTNTSTVTGTAQASGVAILIAAQAGVPVAVHTPTEVKAAITGNGRAQKQQIGVMVTRLLHLESAPRPADAADAAAIAICHLWRGGLPTSAVAASSARTDAQRAWHTAATTRRPNSWNEALAARRSAR